MTWHHRVSRAYWLGFRLKRYPEYAQTLGSAPGIDQQLLLAMSLVWPLARRAFLLNCVHELPYTDIARCLGVDIRTVELGISDALFSMCMICDHFDNSWRHSVLPN